MKFGKVDIIVLIVPVIIMFLLIPVLPAEIPTHFDITGHVNGYISKKYSFVLGVLPFIIFESYKFKNYK